MALMLTPLLPHSLASRRGVAAVAGLAGGFGRAPGAAPETNNRGGVGEFPAAPAGEGGASLYTPPLAARA